jgi:membrane protease YdiL (CAAX protease family)
MNLGDFVLYFIGIAVIGPISEECLYRGLIYTPLYRKVGRFLALVISSILWTHGHYYSLLLSVGVFINGLILGWLYDRRGSLIQPIVFHMFKNSWIFVYYIT